MGRGSLLPRLQRQGRPRWPKDIRRSDGRAPRGGNFGHPGRHASLPDTPEFAGRAKVFGELIDHHATEEERTMFKMARKLFTAAERAQLDVDYEEWKNSLGAAGAMVIEKSKAGARAVAKAISDRPH